MDDTHKKKIDVLEREIHTLKTENSALKQQLSGQKVPLSDDMMDGIALSTLILVICAGLSFWLWGMPS